MKKKQSYFISRGVEEEAKLDFYEYADMFQDGYSDAEISMEFGVNENFVKKLRDEYQRDN